MIDELDRKILAILDWNARMPATHIAKRLRANKDVVARRIQKLEESKTIANYYPVLNLRRLGYYTHRLNFDTVELTAAREAEFVAFLDKDIGAGLIYRMDSPYKYGVYVWTKGMYELEGILLRIKKFLGTQLTKYRYMLLCTITQYPKDTVFAKRFHSDLRLVNEEGHVSHDDHDLLVLRALAHNARSSTIDISKRTGIPQQTVSSKIKAMERKGIILGYRAEIAIQHLGFEHYAFEVYLSDWSEVDKLRAWANVDPHVTWFEPSVGGIDVDFALEVRDRAHLETELMQLRQRFPSIRKLIHYTERYWKLTYVP
jgi:Lrp/AsnC family transcriptional regulator, leucine-responsive regulatory protein